MIIRHNVNSAGDTEVVLDRAEMALLLLAFNPKASAKDALENVDDLLKRVEQA